MSRRYFDASRSIVTATARGDVPELAAATLRMLERVDADEVQSD